MTKSVSFNVRLENDPTKNQEIELMSKMVAQFKGTGTYMEMFLNKAADEWFESMVRFDFAPDVMDHLAGADVSANVAREDLKTSREASAIWEKDAEYLRERLVELDVQYKKEMAEKVAEVDEWIGKNRKNEEQALQYFNELRRVEAQVDHLDEANVRLKAQLYDRAENKIEDIEDRLHTLENPPAPEDY